MRKSLIKISFLLLFTGLVFGSVRFVGQTVAYYVDTETSSDNSFSAGSLDFSLDSSTWDGGADPLALLPSDEVTKTVSLINDGTLGFQYTASTTKTSGDDVFCNALSLEAKLDGVTKYSGGLMSFLSGPFVFGAPEDWTFKVTLPADASSVAGKSCGFDFVFKGYEEGGAPDTGFNDTEITPNILTAAEEKVTFDYSPIADSFVDEHSPTGNHGTESDLKIKSKSSDDNRRSVIRFDSRFPSGTTIATSSLRLFMSDAPSASRIYNASRLSGSWIESSTTVDDITWNNQPATSSPITASTTSGTTNNVWLSFNVGADVKGFVDGTFQNYGWEFYDSSESSATSREGVFKSRNNGDESKRPVLEVAFRTPAATTTHLVVNEVYYDVGDSPNKGSDGTNEWVEIYNPTDATVDIKDWQICDSGTCDTISTTSPSILLESHKFAVITPNVSTWTKWVMPAGTVEIVLGSNIGGGLANTGDAVILKNSSAVEIDSMSYGSNTSKLNPSVPTSGDGNSLARIVKGYDTNHERDWVISASPNPGTNPSDDSGFEVMRFTSDGILVASVAVGLEPLPGDVHVDELGVDESSPLEIAVATPTDTTIASTTEPSIASSTDPLVETADTTTASTTDSIAPSGVSGDAGTPATTENTDAALPEDNSAEALLPDSPDAVISKDGPPPSDIPVLPPEEVVVTQEQIVVAEPVLEEPSPAPTPVSEQVAVNEN